MIGRNLYILVLFGIMTLIIGCDQNSSQASDGTRWLNGSDEEKFELVEKHLRGFDMAMVETGHRYVELHWAGQDENWGYAAYQARKIRKAIDNGIERRPKRAESAQMIYPVLEEVQAAIEAEDAAQFQEQFTALTATCNACHQAEDVSFVTVAPPRNRASPVDNYE